MERWLNQNVQDLAKGLEGVGVVNPFGGKGYVRNEERNYRQEFRTPEAQEKIDGVVEAVAKVLNRDR